MKIKQLNSNPKIISKIRTIIQFRSKIAPSSKIGFVPTMGYLHEGHISLIKKARTENDIIIVSIFVNPAQFGPKEDLSRYPRDLERDLKILRKLSVDAVFTPSAGDIYPEGFSTFIEPIGSLSNEAEGASRPGHFRGVATIVLKLFNIIMPHRAYFGQKDAQQATVIKRLITDLNLPVKLQIMPIIREHNGLAMSSRNSYLNPVERKSASIIYQSLLKAKNFIITRPSTPISSILKIISDSIRSEPLARLDYIQIRNPEDFQELKTLKAPMLLLIAVKFGHTRLIDNFLLRVDGSWETGIIISKITLCPIK